MRITFTPLAETEITEALAWYWRQAPDAASHFLDELRTLIARLETNPFQFPLTYRNTRKANFRRFPYSLFFRLQTDSIEIFACFHTSRDPAHWQRRI